MSSQYFGQKLAILEELLAARVGQHSAQSSLCNQLHAGRSPICAALKIGRQKGDPRMSGQRVPILTDTKRACIVTVVAVIVGVCVQYGYVHDWHYTHASQERAAAEKAAEETRASAAEGEREKQHQIAEVEAMVAASLKDPQSAQFRDVYIGISYACGQVDARNGFGGYTGFSDFFVSGVASFYFGDAHLTSGAKAYIRDPDMADTVWGHMLPDECLTHWAGQRGMDWLKRVRGL
ncbi:hypothetical protein KDW55_27860 [Burkholderia sp. AU19243]|uniref:hypothetical protein n=1 Tax=Burkholderia TaxID=32008 RepID=UPI001B91430F|nr:MULTISPECIES: hypothetical protein [Burkholderia]MBR8367142.1 hypothetical protein [Burkholderia sp. AU19243]UKV76422.1 hypothetical protein FOC29_18920 [Burkholderia vietnamiensis]